MAAELFLLSRAEYTGLHAAFAGQPTLSFAVQQVSPQDIFKIALVLRLISGYCGTWPGPEVTLLPETGCRQMETLDLMRLHEWAAFQPAPLQAPKPRTQHVCTWTMAALV